MRPCPATPTSNLEGQRGLGLYPGRGAGGQLHPDLGLRPRGEDNAPPRPRGGGGPQPRQDKGARPPSLLRGPAPARPCALQPPPPQAAADPPGPCAQSQQRGLGAQAGGRWAAPPGTERSSQGCLHPHMQMCRHIPRQECPQAALGNPSPAPTPGRGVSGEVSATQPTEPPHVSE